MCLCRLFLLCSYKSRIKHRFVVLVGESEPCTVDCRVIQAAFQRGLVIHLEGEGEIRLDLGIVAVPRGFLDGRE